MDKGIQSKTIDAMLEPKLSDLEHFNLDFFDLAVDYTTPKKESCDTVVTFRYFAEDKSQVESDLPQIGQPVKLDILGFRSNILFSDTGNIFFFTPFPGLNFRKASINRRIKR